MQTGTYLHFTNPPPLWEREEYQLMSFEHGQGEEKKMWKIKGTGSSG
jgi:hypothetical protein